MKAKLLSAYGYQGDAMNLPVADIDSAASFYIDVMGFRIESRSQAPNNSIVLERDNVRMALAENGGDPSQDGCAFHVDSVEALWQEFKSNGLQKELPDFSTENHGENSFKVFYVVAPDGLCFWFGEKLA
ncbi:MAG TPA: VOC family protein [Pyrinomonadaceae bacterium]|nr:VOC family protein [Pyrinomonadaceae bacterium]